MCSCLCLSSPAPPLSLSLSLSLFSHSLTALISSVDQVTPLDTCQLLPVFLFSLLILSSPFLPISYTVNAMSHQQTLSHEHEDTDTYTKREWDMHALSLQGSQVADIFHFCAYKVIIILVGVTEQGSIHCHCQPPINIPLLQGNRRSSRDLQFTQLRSMWTKPSILSLSLFFLPLLSPIPAPHFPITAPLTLLLCASNFFLFSFSYLLSPALLPPPWFLALISLSCMASTPFLSPLHLSFFCLSPLIDTVVTHWTEFSRFLWKLQRVMRWG